MERWEVEGVSAEQSKRIVVFRKNTSFKRGQLIVADDSYRFVCWNRVVTQLFGSCIQL